MNKKELHQILYANGVPIKTMDWTFSELDNAFLKRKLLPMLENIEEFLLARESFILYTPTNPLLASRLAVTFMKAAIIEGYYRVKYTVPNNLVGYKMEDWDGGDAYNELLAADLLVIDKIIPFKKQDGFRQEVFEAFIEDRILINKSTILVCGETPNIMFPERLRALINSVGIKIISMEGVSFVTQ